MNINIGYVVSDLYTHILSVSILSLLQNSGADDEFNIFVLNSDVSEESKRKIEVLKEVKDFRIEYINMKNSEFEGIAEGISVVSNYRIKMASVLPKLDKILFLDSDMIIMDSMAELYNTDLGENYFAAVIDPGAELQRQYTIEDDDKFPNPRFNTGVMLVNLKKWREDDIERKIFDGLRWYSKKYACWPDQNVMQMVCKDKILTLNPSYNVSPILKQQNLYQVPGLWEQSSKDPKIIHICGMPKYWQKSRLLWEDIFWKYAKKTPYYEEFISYLSDAKIEDVNNSIKAIFIEIDMLKHRIDDAEKRRKESIILLDVYFHPFRFFLKKIKYRLMKHLTFGKRKRKYKNKYNLLQNRTESATQFIKEMKNGI